ncbi:MAG: hypothetical protein PHR14_06355 [Oscillospiraceae bacterium]|nr:hypothetical protein [Oscillospiraceae bacterium]
MNSASETIISTTANLSLDGTYAGNTGLRIFTGANPKVNVKVTGSWFVINKLGEQDIKVEGDYNDIKGVGEWPIRLTASKNGTETDYNITPDISPRTTSIFCDYSWSTIVPMETDVTGIKVDEKTGLSLGRPVIHAPGVENNTISIEGPKSIVSQISKVTAKVDKPGVITEVTSFTASLTAYDIDGNEVDTDLCVYVGLVDRDNKVNVAVPVNIKKTIRFNYTLDNTPDGLKGMKNFITMSPSSIDILGAPEQVDAFVQEITTIAKFDYNQLSLNDKKKVIPLNIPEGINVIDGTTEVTVSLNMSSFSSKSLDLTLTSGNTLVVNRPSDRSWSMSAQKIKVVLNGRKASLDKIKASDLSAVIDMKFDNTLGVREFKSTIRISGYDDVWVYYGKTEPVGYSAFLTVK